MIRKYKKAAMNAILILSISCTALMSVSCSEKKQMEELSPIAEDIEVNDALQAPYEAEGLRFSVKSGFYDTAFYLSISAADDSEIYYTLDGSIPTDKSERYEKPLLITDRSTEENILSTHTDIALPVDDANMLLPKTKVDKATVIRAVTIDKNGVRSNVVSNTYFVGFDKKADFYKNTKIISLIADENDLFDSEKGIYVLGKVFEDWRNGDDYDASTPDWFIPANYTQKGREWEREAAIQFFEDGDLTFTQNVGIRIHGGATRSYAQKSFNIYARSDYGAPKLEYDLFSGNVKSETDGSPISSFDTFILRNGGNDAQLTRFRDKLAQSLISERQFLTQGMESCIVFVDGEFWGHYDITEKLDNDFISAHYCVPAKDICIIKKEALDDGSEETFAEWEELRKWIQNTDFSEQEAYDKLCGFIDMQGFMDYVSAEIYINNANWGRSNMAMWKAETESKDTTYADGKWRFIMFDTDYSSRIYGEAQASENSFEKLMNSDCFLADLFNGALENEGFRKKFAETFMDIADNDFINDMVNSEIDKLSAEQREMTIATYDRFWSGMIGGELAESNYESSVEDLRSFYNKRYEYITKYLKEIV